MQPLVVQTSALTQPALSNTLPSPTPPFPRWSWGINPGAVPCSPLTA
jgi:hypothetical protein